MTSKSTRIIRSAQASRLQAEREVMRMAPVQGSNWRAVFALAGNTLAVLSLLGFLYMLFVVGGK